MQGVAKASSASEKKKRSERGSASSHDRVPGGGAASASERKKKTCRHERERAVWTAMHGFVTARPEQFVRECGNFTITAPQATLLRVMDPERPLPMSALATALACHASNVTGLVDRLEEQGFVERRSSEEDRRVKHICLTPKGVEAREGLCSALFAPPPELARLDEDELAALEKLLRRIEVASD
jgi:DNA-binding MarR family transcriptional regulator